MVVDGPVARADLFEYDAGTSRAPSGDGPGGYDEGMAGMGNARLGLTGARWWWAGFLVMCVMLALAPGAGAAVWSIEPTPAVPGATSVTLTGVSCTSDSACVAVGSYVDSTKFAQPLTESWNGSSWTIHPVPVPSRTFTASLLAVSCTSPDACTAVGSYANTPIYINGAPLAERWNGSSWSMQLPPDDPDFPGQNHSTISLNAVSCTSATACTAVGDDNGDGNWNSFAEVWDGSTWVFQRPPQHQIDAGGDTSNFLNGISCLSPGACETDGSDGTLYTGYGTVAQVWDGTSWSVQPTPDDADTTHTGTPSLQAVSCADSEACTAVGATTVAAGGSTSGTALAERWDGADWAIQPTANVAGRGFAQLNGVACPNQSVCVAAGSSGASLETPQSTPGISGAGRSRRRPIRRARRAQR